MYAVIKRKAISCRLSNNFFSPCEAPFSSLFSLSLSLSLSPVYLLISFPLFFTVYNIHLYFFFNSIVCFTKANLSKKYSVPWIFLLLPLYFITHTLSFFSHSHTRSHTIFFFSPLSLVFLFFFGSCHVFASSL
ncbi:hypothetical protein EDC94DRAFT_346957 [Helicostylum pulchrum]|nr:hypothetical protein EDC94DRAFT_346957 [Helicostylum pulchrum]